MSLINTNHLVREKLAVTDKTKVIQFINDNAALTRLATDNK